MFEQPFDTPGAALAHYGKKGMKWGVVNEDSKVSAPKSKADKDAEFLALAKKQANDNAQIKSWIAATEKSKQPLTQAEIQKNIIESETKFAKKFGDPAKVNALRVAPIKKAESPGGGQKPNTPKEQARFSNKQKAALAGAGLLAVGGAAWYLKSKGVGNTSFLSLEDVARQTAREQATANKYLLDIKALAGKSVKAQEFNGFIMASKSKTWYTGNYFTPEAFTRPEFTLNPGHVFHRISTKIEDSHNPTSYVTASIEDFNRYVAGFRQEKSGSALHHITFKTEAPVKVPALHTVLGTLHEASGGKLSQDQVLKSYQDMSGGGWTTPAAKSLIASLQQKGYGAIVDEMDAGVIGEAPLVIFAKSLGGKVSKPLTVEAIKAAEDALIELENRKL